MNLNGTSAIVSGGASGLGEATSRALAAAGATVVIADLNEAGGKRIADEINGLFARTDVSDETSVQAAVDMAAAAGPPLRTAVSCAGIGWAARTLGRDGTPHDLASYQKVIAINLTAQERINEELLGREVFHENGRIVSVSSMSGIAGNAGRAGAVNREVHDMTKEELLEFEGLVIEILPDARYRVQLDNGHALIAYTAGRMKKNRIKTLAGDRVTVELSPYDLEKGRLVFRHKDVAHAEEQLASVKDKPGKKLLISDGVFSMDGDIGPLPGLCDVAEKYGAIMMVDDAHASGVLGRNGRGTIDHFKVHGRVDIQVGTLSKAIGALGGYVCGTRDLIDSLYHRARPFLFSTSHPPSVAATCIAAFDVLENEPERMEKLWENTRFWKKELGLLGFDIGGRATPASETPITPIIIGDGKLTMDFSRELFKEGVLGTGIAFPTVPEGKARIRTIMTATHTKEELEQALEVLGRVGKRMGIL